MVAAWRGGYAVAAQRYVVSFAHFHERGLATPAHKFLWGLLRFYKIEVQYLNPNGIQHMASRSGEAEPAPKGSGETEITASRSGEAEPTPKGSGEVEPTHLGTGWSHSRALDYLDELMLMTISPSSLSTLVLLPDSSP